MGIKTQLLGKIALKIAECQDCGLHKFRNCTVPGEGHHNARAMFIGEGPGQKEDETGSPFVGDSGQLLNNILAAFSFKREEIYIANIVKCRPPGNRNPMDDEIAACKKYLDAQIKIVNPKVIVLLGSVASQSILGLPVSVARGSLHTYLGRKVIATYHPSYLLHITDPDESKAKRFHVCQDMKMAVEEIGNGDE